MEQKESNFISAVGYLRNDAARAEAFLSRVSEALSARLSHWELILVNDASSDGGAEVVRRFSAERGVPVTLVNMSLAQGRELCMNAGLDMAIGDYVFEFDTLDTGWERALMDKAYETALTGYDIVSVSPLRNRSAASSLFYRLFNASSGSRYAIHTDAFRLLSRRAINRVHAVTPTPAYRKAAYAASGLRLFTLRDASVHTEKGDSPRVSLALDSLTLYTNAAFRLSFGIAALMLAGTLAELVYTLVIFFSAQPVAGWTTTMFVLTVGFFGVFVILTFVLKYLSLLVELVFKQQKYLVESVEKLQ